MRQRRREAPTQQQRASSSSTNATVGESTIIHSKSSRNPFRSLIKCHSTIKAGDGRDVLFLLFYVTAIVLVILAVTILMPSISAANGYTYCSSQLLVHHDGQSQQESKEKNHDDTSIQRFMTWFRASGGRLAPGVTLSYFPDYGGHGLSFFLNDTNNKNPHDDDANNSENNNNNNTVSTVIMQAGVELLRVPQAIQFTAQKSLDRLRKIVVKDDEDNLANLLALSVQRYFPESALEQQDVIIAMQLMVECSLGKASRFVPYLDILQPPMRLDTFSKDELKVLQDPFLEQLALHSQRQMKMAWNHGGLAWIVAKWAELEANGSDDGTLTTGRHEKVDETHAELSCLSFESFHRFVALGSSHAMILENSTKYLVPMADMINHAPAPLFDDSKTVSTPMPSPLFTDNHVRDATDGSIVVKADRMIIQQHDSQQQIFEEYGQLDNSLYLVAHGFVPHQNPHHCVVIPAGGLLLYNDDSRDPIVLAVTGMVLMELLLLGNDDNSDSSKLLPFDNVCVNRKGVIQNDVNGARKNGGPPSGRVVSAALVIAHDLQNDAALFEKCKRALQQATSRSDNNNNNRTALVAASCTKGHNAGSNIKEQHVDARQIIAEAAQKMMNRYTTSLQYDISLLEKVQLVLSTTTRQELNLDASITGAFDLHSEHDDDTLGDEGSVNHYEKVALALQFRIADKQLLHAIIENAASS